MDMDTKALENAAHAMELSAKIVKSIRNRVYFQFQALAPALFQMPTQFAEKNGTDGQKVYINPQDALGMYMEDTKKLEHLYLHMIMHCVYLHPFLPVTSDNRDAYEAAVDICCEAAVKRLNEKYVSQEETEVLEAVGEKVKLMLPSTVCHLISSPEFAGNGWSIQDLKDMFHVDDNLFLDMHSQENSGDSGNGGNGQNPRGNRDQQQNSRNENRQNNSGSGQDSQNKQSNGNDSGQNSQDQSNNGGGSGLTKEDWQNISRQVAVDLQSFHTAGSDPGQTVQELEYLTQDRVSYDEFLKDFAVTEEVMKLDMDEFDLGFYSYGLSQPGEKPLLVEPLEYKDEKRCKEFVIAIDTSGSCSGEVVQAFVKKTFSILKDTETFSSRVNVHIVQCDASVQHDEKIENLKQLDSYMQGMKIYGFGGTDFRPVFQYVDTLMKKGELSNKLQGLIYFTDGYGRYPTEPTPYKTAFVFLEDYDFSDRDVPAWAYKAIWSLDETTAEKAENNT